MTYDGYTMSPVEVSVSRLPQSYSQPVPVAQVAQAQGFSLKDIPTSLLSMFGAGSGGGALSSALGLGAGGSSATQSTDFRADSSTSVTGATKNSVAGNTSTIIQTGSGRKDARVDQTSEPNVGNLTSPLSSLGSPSVLAWVAVLGAVGLIVWVIGRK